MDDALFHGNIVNSRRILYTPSAFARSNLLHLQEIGSLTAQRPHVSRRENLASCLFFLVENGQGELRYEDRIWQLKSGDCVFIDCRHPYSHSTAEPLWSLRWAHFFGPNLNSIYDKYAERGGLPCFRPADSTRYRTLLEELYQIAASSDHIKDMKIYEKLASLLTLLMEESWNPGAHPEKKNRRRNVQAVKDYLDQHYSEKISLDNLAEQFYINKFYLTRIFREQFGLSVSAYLQQVRITHAKQLLRFTDQSIEKTGQECGMNDANYFSRIFRKTEGVSPGEYRKQW